MPKKSERDDETFIYRSVRVRRDLAARVDSLAATDKRSFNFAGNQALEEWVEKREQPRTLADKQKTGALRKG